MKFIPTAFHAKGSEIKFLIGKFLHSLRAVSWLNALALLAILSVASGCGGETSPSAPAVVSDIQEGKAVALSHAALHAILVVDTNATGSVSEAMERDLDYMSNLVDSIASYTDMRVNKQVLSGRKATKAMMEQAIETLSVGSDDVILFYFSGHGGRTRSTATQWPDMYLQNSFALNLHEVFSRLNSKGGRLVFALSDSCNNFLDAAADSSSAHLAALRGRSEGYRKLFLEGRAAIIASGSLAGELSYMQSEGSLFTRQFLQAFSTEVSSSQPDWNDLMDAATHRIRTSGVQQQPQYVMY